MNRVNHLIEKLDLIPHPEGGCFRETYRSKETIDGDSKEPFPAGRSYGTAIYYLLKGEDVSRFHRIQSDETWHFYEGSPSTVHIIHPDGLYEARYLGSDLEAGQHFQHVIPANSWFGVSVDDPDGFILAGCTVAPGFDFNDFEMGDSYMLKQAFPEHKEIIEKLS